MKLPYSQDIERTFLATLIKYPEIIPDYLEHLTDDLFHNPVHKTIAAATRFQFNLKKTVDVVILADHISNIGLKHQDDLDLPDYIKNISIRNSVTPDKAEIYFKECFKYKIARSSIESCRQTELLINKAINGSIADVIQATERGLTKAITASIEDEYKPIDIYEGMDSFLEDLGQDGKSDGILTPFKTWNRWWGPLTAGDLTVIASPPKTGKSTILNYIADAPFCRYNKGKKIKVLILDTELETYRVRTRKASALSDVNESHIKSGRWQKNDEMVEKISAQFPTMKKRSGGFVKHLYVANVPIDKICSIVRRWAATECDPDDERLVVYDYMKITGEQITNFNQEWQALGQKCDTLKHLLSEEGVRAAGLVAVQTNSFNDVAASQRIKWFASNIFFFTKRSPEEIVREGEEFGTHYIQPFVLRNQEEDWENEMYVKEQKEKGVVWTLNKLFITVKNFDMKESGTLSECAKKAEEQIDISGPEFDIKKKPLRTIETDDLL